MKTRLWSLISYGAVALALAACSPPAQKTAEPAKPVASAEWTADRLSWTAERTLAEMVADAWEFAGGAAK